MATNLKICWVCVAVSGLWFVMSVLVAWQAIPLATLELPIALLMGGSVVGVAYQRQSLRWKITVIAIGMPAAFFLLTNLTKTVVIIELIVLLILAYVLFAKKKKEEDNSKQAQDLEEKLKQCC